MGQAVHTIEFAAGSAALANPDRVSAYALNAQAFFASAASVTALGSITAGTGFRMLPSLTFTGGTGSGGLLVATSLKGVGTPTVGFGGSGYAVNDTITLQYGVVVTVAAVASGVITSFNAVTTPGAMTAYAAPANPMPQVSTSGAGVGATVNVTWGLGTAQIVNSGNYSVVPVVTITPPDGNGSGASFAANTLGGNGAAILVGQTGLNLPSTYGADATPSIAAFVSCPLKRADCFAIALTPIAAASTLAAGTVDINLAG